MIFSPVNINKYFDALYPLGVVAWYDGPLETIYVSEQRDFCFSVFENRGTDDYHYLMKGYKEDDYARYLMRQITVNELEDLVVSLHTANIGIEPHFVDVIALSLKDNKNYQIREENFYYNDAEMNFEIVAYFKPHMKRIGRTSKIDTLW